MIPGINGFQLQNFELKEQPSKNYKMYLINETVNGLTDKLDAMKQVIYKILNTERYQYPIYSWNYGIELVDLFGEPVTYVCPELERRIAEALTQDERILSVDAFSFEFNEKRKIYVNFTAHTVFGDINDIEKVVNI